MGDGLSTHQGTGSRLRRLLPVRGNKRRQRGRLDAQSIEVTYLSGWRTGYCKGTLAGAPIVTFALRPPLSRLEVVVDGPDQCRPLQALL